MGWVREARVKEMGEGCQGGTSKCPCAVGGRAWCPSSCFPFSYPTHWLPQSCFGRAAPHSPGPTQHHLPASAPQGELGPWFSSSLTTVPPPH